MVLNEAHRSSSYKETTSGIQPNLCADPTSQVRCIRSGASLYARRKYRS